MKEEKEEVKLVPCSKCSAPVLPNLAECMFCGQKDPGKLAASSMGEQFVNMRHSLRAKLRSDRKKRPAFEFATPIEKLRYHLVSDDRSYIYVIMASSVLLFMLALAIGSQGACAARYFWRNTDRRWSHLDAFFSTIFAGQLYAPAV